MLKIETNLKLSDYQRLLFYNYASKSIEKIEKEHTKVCREKPKLKDTYHVAVFGKTIFDEILKYIEKLKGE